MADVDQIHHQISWLERALGRGGTSISETLALAFKFSGGELLD